MPKKKKRLDLNKLTVVRLDDIAQDNARGKGGDTELSACCTVLMTTCVPVPWHCYPNQSIPPGGDFCI